MSKALTLLQKGKTTKERADSYIISIQRNLQRDIIDKLTADKENIDDKLFELLDFNLETNLNEGKVNISKDECERRFKEVINLEFKKELLEKEIEVKTKSFNKYFGDGKATK